MLNIKATWIYIIIGGGIVIVAGVLGIGMLALAEKPARSSPTPFVDTSPTPENFISIGGTVWHDLCVNDDLVKPVPGAIPSGCIPGPDDIGIFGNGIHEDGEPGLGGIHVNIGLGACPSFGLGEAVTNAEGAFLFENLPAGPYCVSIEAGDNRNAGVLSLGRWTTPASGTGIAAVTVAISSTERFRSLNFGWDYDLLPVPETTPTSTSTPPNNADACSDRAQFVTDVTISDNTRLDPGKSFEKTWRIKNIGTCTWTKSYAVTFVNGDRLSAPESSSFKEDVKPGATIDITISMKAPSSNGTYRGNWKIKNDQGNLFGIGENYSNPFWVQITVGQGGAGGLYPWKGEYFSNLKLDGTAAFVRYDPSIDFNWKRGAPDKSISENNFSVRWTGKQSFSTSAIYRFRVLVDDGVRLWVDNFLILDSWKNGSERELTVDVLLVKGTHDIRLEYYEHTGDARIRLKWEKIDSPKYPEWKGEYWTNRDLDGDPLFVRNDKSINFSWGTSSPATGIPADNFSARWTRKFTFENARYIFQAHADDGIRIYLDGTRILNEWHASDGSTLYKVERLVSAGEHKITVEYYEKTNKALVKVWWEKVQATATPTPPSSSTPTPTSTSTDTPTPTPTPTEEDAPTSTATGTEAPPSKPELVNDFVDNMCQASWRNEGGELLCPGPIEGSEGGVFQSQNQTLENGVNAASSGIILYPPKELKGWVEGRFPGFKIQDKDRFTAMFSCISGNTECDLGVEIQYRDASGEIRDLLSWHEIHDSNVREVDIDLSALAGETVQFIITVDAENVSEHNYLVVYRPGIWRQEN